ncbi:U20-hexatoxin-Hi1a-like [Parasteatoda tepidariorum]|uniref:U20-hexatoxin-Hi1a-like n=1 Tax=Parasteatoda tepidariorum TaxID=114398 RepID=UPI000A2BFC9B|nr:equistatin-like isoform X3 [Parasteatoda tepidariorum]XP_042903565.1 equistatin-like isoform X3 [Parasteatoda tepidariorum]
MKIFALLALFCSVIAMVIGAQTACQLQRQQAQAKNLKGSFVPKCDSDGSYSQVQCRGSTGFCWCADKDGKQITKSVRGKPKC